MMSKKNPLCGCDSGNNFLASDVNHKRSNIKFNYIKCKKCNLIRILKIPEDLSNYYPENYYIYPSIDKLKKIGDSDPFKIKLLTRFIKHGLLLEIGPAFGVFAYQALLRGFKVHAIEMDDKCCQYLRSVVGLNVHKSHSPEKIIGELPSFNVIALWHVIEHVPDPWALLSAISRNLESGGYLMLSAPNPDSWQFKLMGVLWPHLDAPRHLYLIPSSVLISYCKTLGFNCVHVTTVDGDSRKWDSFSWQRFFMNYFDDRRLKIVAQAFGMIISLFTYPISVVLKSGSAYTIIFIKE